MYDHTSTVQPISAFLVLDEFHRATFLVQSTCVLPAGGSGTSYHCIPQRRRPEKWLFRSHEANTTHKTHCVL